jgi:hypothetical protein
MAVFLDAAPGSLVEGYRRIRGLTASVMKWRRRENLKYRLKSCVSHIPLSLDGGS